MVVVFSEYLSPLWGFILLGWYVYLLPLVGAFCSRYLSSVLLLTISLLAVLLDVLPCCGCIVSLSLVRGVPAAYIGSTLYKFITNPYKHNTQIYKVCYLLVVLLLGCPLKV